MLEEWVNFSVCGRKKRKKRVFFSPILELARFFGTTSAKTDQVQVGFSQKDRGVALLSMAIGLHYFTVLCSIHYPTWCILGTEKFQWVYRRAA